MRLPGLLLAAAFIANGLPAQIVARSPAESAIFTESMRFSDSRRDPDSSLILDPSLQAVGARRVRESSWYALGLLTRNAPGDKERAIHIINLVLSYQLRAPGEPWDGTFRRSPEDPTPGPRAVMWQDYDPNWREFIGTTFALTLIQFEKALPPQLCSRMTESIRLALDGERAQKRLSPHYTNIAIMYGFLLSYAGHRLQRPDYIRDSDRWAEEVHGLYSRNGTFEEYNSPTYYGVDLYGLALWRRYGPTEAMRRYGAEMEAGLWREIGLFYNASLHNLCGPFDRAYGMDMDSYVSLVGAWMGLVIPRPDCPLPDSSLPMDHERDFECIPTYVAVGTEIPPDVRQSLLSFSGERVVSRVIDEKRKATAWISRDLMMGGEVTHWRSGPARVGWIVLREAPSIDAVVEPGRLRVVTARGKSVFWVHVDGIDTAAIKASHWELPGLSLSVDTDGTLEPVTSKDGVVLVSYRDATRFILNAVKRVP